MLEYIVSGNKPANPNSDIDEVDNIVTKIKSKKEVTTEYMRWFDEKRSIERQERFEIARSTIRFDRSENIMPEATRRRLLAMGLENDDIDDLLAEIDAEELVSEPTPNQ